MTMESDELRLLNDLPPTAIETIGLTRAFGDHVAVSNVAFSVRPGEIFGLIGRNGAGKSTLVKMLTTMLAPTSGRARVAGFDVAAESRKVRAHIGYVPQLLSADGALTAYENLLLSARLYLVPRRERETRIAAAFARDWSWRRRAPIGSDFFRRHDPAARDRPEHAASSASVVHGRAYGRARPGRGTASGT